MVTNNVIDEFILKIRTVRFGVRYFFRHFHEYKPIATIAPCFFYRENSALVSARRDAIRFYT